MKQIKRILVDVSVTSVYDRKTGVQRVVRNIVKNLTQKDLDIEIIPFNMGESGIVVAKDWTDTISPNKLTSGEITLQEDDYILILDLIDVKWKQHFNLFLEAKKLGITIGICHYDIIPIKFPQYWNHNNRFEQFVNLFFVNIVDEIICISKTIADETIQYLKDKNITNPQVSYFHLGSDFEESKTSTEVDFVKNKDYILMVGTIEPRKNHLLAIETMNLLWQKGSDLCLVICGSTCWSSMDYIFFIIKNHPEYNKKLFFVEGISDGQLHYLYQNAKGLLQLSIDEGCGLPLIEAANYGTQIVCSDIPVFREVVGDCATYVSLNKDLCAYQLERWYKYGEKYDMSKVKNLTWDQSASELLDAIYDKRIYKESNKSEIDYNTLITNLELNDSYNEWKRLFPRILDIFNAYNSLLKRNPDEIGFDHYLYSDISVEEIRTSMMESGEYKNLNR